MLCCTLYSAMSTFVVK